MITLVTMETNDRFATLTTLFTSKDFKDGDRMLNLNVNQHIRPKQNAYEVSWQSNSHRHHIRGGKGALNKVLYGEAPPRGPTPYRFIYHFWQKRYPFRIASIEKIVPLSHTYLRILHPFSKPLEGSLLVVFHVACNKLKWYSHKVRLLELF